MAFSDTKMADFCSGRKKIVTHRNEVVVLTGWSYDVVALYLNSELLDNPTPQSIYRNYTDEPPRQWVNPTFVKCKNEMVVVTDTLVIFS